MIPLKHTQDITRIVLMYLGAMIAIGLVLMVTGGIGLLALPSSPSTPGVSLLTEHLLPGTLMLSGALILTSAVHQWQKSRAVRPDAAWPELHQADKVGMTVMFPQALLILVCAALGMASPFFFRITLRGFC